MAPLGCGDDSGARGDLRRLSRSEESIVSRAQASTFSYCGKLARYLAGKGKLPTEDEDQKVDDDLDRLIALAREKPDARSQRGDTPRLVLGDIAEDLEGSNCSAGFEQKLERALAELPPEQ
jgi:hypothetical protein